MKDPCSQFLYIYKNSLFNGKKPVHVIVNCWFCNQNTEVPYGNRNCWDCPFCNGDYNEPILAQYMEHLNHGVSAGVPVLDASKTQPDTEDQAAGFLHSQKGSRTITMEIEVYKRHLEQTYELCVPVRPLSSSDIQHQNRQLWALLFNHQLRCSQDADKAFIKVKFSRSQLAAFSLRSLAFLTCAFLVAVAICGSGCDSGDTSSLHNSPHTLSGGIIPPKEAHQSDIEAKSGSNHQMAVASVGLLTSINIYSGSKKKCTCFWPVKIQTNNTHIQTLLNYNCLSGFTQAYVLNTSLLTTSSKRFCSTVCAKSTFPHSSHQS
uniref:Transmembrane protein n=1 Tax=Electrophorus electricus TaxID=8005 RepID=A0AAY5EU34_ELEEL